MVGGADEAEAAVAPQIGKADLLAFSCPVHLEGHLPHNAAHIVRGPDCLDCLQYATPYTPLMKEVTCCTLTLGQP